MLLHPSYGFSGSLSQEQQHGGRAKLWGGRDSDFTYVLCSELVFGTIQLEKITGVGEVVLYCVK
jgi:hypothetical protein